MKKFMSLWFFDWLTVTLPNPDTGTGQKTRGPRGKVQESEALDALTSFATVCGLRKQRIGRGSDSYLANMNLADDPSDSERMMTIRAGHASNMPGLEIPGGRGRCQGLAEGAFDLLGPLMLARADVALDVKQPGIFEELQKLCVEFSRGRKRMEAPTFRGDPIKGRTCYFGGKYASLKIYEKGKERVTKKTAKEGDENAHPDLVRIEFTIRGEKSGRKHALGKIAAEEGAGGLLGSVYWIRHLVEKIAVALGDVDEVAAVMEVSRLQPRPDPRPVEDRAEHGRQQYAGTFIAEAAKFRVAENGGDWSKTKISVPFLVDRAILLMKPILQQKAEEFVDDNGLYYVRDGEDEAERLKAKLEGWMDRFREKTEFAQAKLENAEFDARARSGLKPDVQPEQSHDVGYDEDGPDLKSWLDRVMRKAA